MAYMRLLATQKWFTKWVNYNPSISQWLDPVASFEEIRIDFPDQNGHDWGKISHFETPNDDIELCPMKSILYIYGIYIHIYIWYRVLDNIWGGWYYWIYPIKSDGVSPAWWNQWRGIARSWCENRLVNSMVLMADITRNYRSNVAFELCLIYKDQYEYK